MDGVLLHAGLVLIETDYVIEVPASFGRICQRMICLYALRAFLYLYQTTVRLFPKKTKNSLSNPRLEDLVRRCV